MALAPFTYQKVPLRRSYSPSYVLPGDDDLDDQDPRKQDPAPAGELSSISQPAIDPALVQSVQQKVSPPLPSVEPDQETGDYRTNYGPPPPTYEPQLPQMAAPPVMIGEDKYGRPERAIGGTDELERQQDLLNSIHGYIPKKAHGWSRYLPAIQAGIELASRPRPGDTGSSPLWREAGAALGGFIGGGINPKLRDQIWQQRKAAEVQGDLEDATKQAKAQAEIENYESLKNQRKATADLKKAGFDRAGKKIADDQLRSALKDYNELEHYVPGENPSLDAYFASRGLHDLPPRDKATNWTMQWGNGELVRVNKATGEAKKVEGVSRPAQRAAIQTVTIGGKSQQMLLTPAEAIKAQQEETNRVQRASLEARKEKGRNARAAMKSASTTPSNIHLAMSLLNKYRSLDVQAEREPDKATQTKLIQQRNLVGAQLRQEYPNQIAWTDKQQPYYIVRWSEAKFRKDKPSASDAEVAAEKAKAEASGATIVP